MTQAPEQQTKPEHRGKILCEKPEPHGIEYMDGECAWCIKEERDALRLRLSNSHHRGEDTPMGVQCMDCGAVVLPNGEWSHPCHEGSSDA